MGFQYILDGEVMIIKSCSWFSGRETSEREMRPELERKEKEEEKEKGKGRREKKKEKEK